MWWNNVTKVTQQNGRQPPYWILEKIGQNLKIWDLEGKIIGIDVGSYKVDDVIEFGE